MPLTSSEYACTRPAQSRYQIRGREGTVAMGVAKFQASIPGLEVNVPETWALNLRDHRRTSEFKWIRRS